MKELKDVRLGFGVVVLLILFSVFAGVTEGKDVTGYVVGNDVPGKIKRQFYDNITSSTNLEFDVYGDLGVSAGVGWVTNNSGQDVELYFNDHRDSGATMQPIPVPTGSVYKIEREDPPIAKLRVESSGNIDIDVELSR